MFCFSGGRHALRICLGYFRCLFTHGRIFFEDFSQHKTNVFDSVLQIHRFCSGRMFLNTIQYFLFLSSFPFIYLFAFIRFKRLHKPSSLLVSRLLPHRTLILDLLSDFFGFGCVAGRSLEFVLFFWGEGML